MLNERTLNKEGIETTLGCHLLHGSYLLSEALRPTLAATKEARVVLVSSGGMYLGKWPGAAKASFQPDDGSYDGQAAYCYAKRGQVLLCEEWSKLHASSGVKFVSCHPG